MWTARRIDRWEEAKAREDEPRKSPDPLTLGADAIFPGLDDDVGVAGLATRAEALSRDATAFYTPPPGPAAFRYADGALTFRSDVATETPANDIAFARIVERSPAGPAAVILPHWNAREGTYRSFADALAKVGVTTAELTLPYHGRRNRDGAVIADWFLSSNLGRTVRSVRQGVLDARRVVDWLEARGHRSIYVMGASLGSCVAGLTGAHDPRIAGSALLLTAGDFADVVWTGRATRHIRAGIEPEIGRDALKAIWSPISLFPYVPKLARPAHRMLIVSARRDRVVLPPLTAAFVDALDAARARLRCRELGCGHYSLGAFPYSWLTFATVARFLRGRGPV